MSGNAQPPNAPNPTGPHQDRSGAAVPVPHRVLRLIPLVRWIIELGEYLTTTLQQNVNPGRDHARYRFLGNPIPTVLARIARGILLARGLEDWLIKRASTGRDLTLARLRLPSLSSTARPGTPRAPRRTNIIDLPLDCLPSAEDIADEFRRRPVGAVLVDICRCLGITHGHLPHELSQALTDAVMLFGGSMLDLLFKDDREREKAGFSYDDWAREDALLDDQPALPSPAALPYRLAACPTGPP